MKDKIKENKKIAIAVVCVILAALLLAMIFVVSGSGHRKLNDFLDLGNKYLDDMNYEEAILVFDEAIAIDPKCAEAYLGKAQAQYALGQVDEAVSTLREGIERVDDSTELEAYLQQILDEQAKAEAEAKAAAEAAAVEAAKAEAPLWLNYSEIVRTTDTADPEIQLEVLGGEAPENYTWESDNPACATVSDTGVVTCQSVEGSAVIQVTNKYGKSDSCYIYISNPEWGIDSETVRFEMEDGDLTEDRFLFASPVEDGDGMRIELGYSSLSGWVYYSGDVVIPEHLVYKGQSMPVTSIDYWAFSYSEELKSLSIPSTVNEFWTQFFGCPNLEKIEVAEENPSYKSVDGVLFSKDGTELLAYPASRPGDSYTVPKEVEKISERAFMGCKNLKEILVEEGNPNYRSVDGVLFTESYDGGDCLLAYPIGNEADKYAVPETVTEIADDAFYRSTLEDVVCKSVPYIGPLTFSECDRLRRLEGGNATKSIYIYGENMVEIAGVEEMDQMESLAIVISGQDGITADLKEIGQLKGLKALTIEGVKDSSGFAWLKELQDLRTFQLGGVVEVEDISILQDLPALNTVSIRGIANLSDISWLEGMQDLSVLYLEANEIGLEDFTGLLEMPNLRNVSIGSHTHHDGLEEQFEKMQEESTERYFSYYEYEDYE